MPLVSSNLISDWRRALIAEFKTAYPDALVTSGRRTGVSREQRITVFSDGFREEAGRVVVARPVMVIRYWPARGDTAAAESPADPTELEQASVDLMTLLEARQTQIESAVTDLWYFRPEQALIDEDREEWGVEVRLAGFARNIAVSYA